MSEAKETIMIDDESEDEGTEELLSVEETCPIARYKQKFDCFLSYGSLAADRFSKNLICSQIYAVSFHFNSAESRSREAISITIRR